MNKERVALRFRILTAAAAAAVLLTSCGGLFEPLGGEVSQASGEVSQTMGAPGGEDARVLSIYNGDETLIVNTAGKVLLSGRNVSVLTDAFTREPAYLVSKRYEVKDWARAAGSRTPPPSPPSTT